MTTSAIKSLALAMVLAISSTEAFMVRPTVSRAPTKLFLEDWVAKLIDEELFRQGHKKEYEEEWMEKNRAAVMSRMETDFMPVEDFDATDFRMYQKDKQMAMKNPEKYCADRCIATGNCDVYEDIYTLSPEQVISFCTECVLSEDADECDIPDGFYDNMTP